MGIELDKSPIWLEFQVSVAVLSHALLFIASLFAPTNGAADVELCQAAPSHMNFSVTSDIARLDRPEHIQRTWARTPHQHSVRVFAGFRARDTAPLRVLGRCAMKPAPEHQQPVLFGSFAIQVDDSDDQNLASAWAAATLRFPFPSAVGARATETFVLRAPRTQLERPPRV
jgi:hypothetical protein